MKCHLFVLLSLLLGTAVAIKSECGKTHTHRITLTASSIIIIFEQRQQKQLQLLPHATTALFAVRGGASSSSSSYLSNKLRNVIRSLLDISEKRAPPLANKLFQTFLKATEKLTGLSLLPPPAVKKDEIKKHGNGRKNRTKKRDIMSETQHSQQATTPTPTTAKKTRKRTTSTSQKRHAASSMEKGKANNNNQHQHHLTTALKSNNPNYRIQRELKEFLQHPPPNLQVKVGSNIRIWVITMTGSGIYEGETFRLRVQFPSNYPMAPPSVYFLPKPALPQHEHVYTNGDICLSLLGKGWLPTMTAQSIAVSIQSILSSAQTKSLPMDNARHSQNKPGQYQKDWVYHDDNC